MPDSYSVGEEQKERTMEDIRKALIDAGCNEAEIVFIQNCIQQGSISDAITAMRRCRCERLEAMHEEARKVDCLDYLIRKSEKERRN